MPRRDATTWSRVDRRDCTWTWKTYWTSASPDRPGNDGDPWGQRTLGKGICHHPGPSGIDAGNRHAHRRKFFLRRRGRSEGNGSSRVIVHAKAAGKSGSTHGEE